MNFQDRLLASIPAGAHTYSRGYDQFPSTAPEILERGKGCFVWDPDGNRFLDYGMALRSVTLGYANERVSEAAIAEIMKGNNLTRASMVELKAAEKLIDLVPSVEMVKFAKNGSNVTTAALKLARAYTGRKYVCVPRQHPFFSFDDWFIGSTDLQRGVPPEHAHFTLYFDFNDIGSLKSLFESHSGEIAAVMLEPSTTITPCERCTEQCLAYETPCNTCPNNTSNFLRLVQDFCNKEGAVFILDEMITGFRWHLKGAHHFFGVQPDLITFGKAMANGFALAALGGRKEIMEVGGICEPGMERTFLLSSTHGGEMCSLGAFLATCSIYETEPICEHLWKFGEMLSSALTESAREFGVADYFSLEGPSIALNYVTKGVDGQPSMELRTLFAQEMARHGVLIPWIAISKCHGEDELDMTIDAARKAFATMARAIDDGPGRYLEGAAIKPVFRKFN